MVKLPQVTGARVARALEKDGWYVSRTTSHLILRHPDRPGRVTVPNHPSRPLRPETLESILDQASLTPERFRELL